MKILILGAKGMLGTELTKVFSDLEPACWDMADLDIGDKKAVFEKVGALAPQLVINAAAYTAVDDCEKNRVLARRVNGLAPGYLAQVCQKLGAVLVHYSTDYVFAGRKKAGYTEKDKPRSPVNYYGVSKLLGEQAIQKYTDKFYLIRTSWLYGQAGKNFVETILRLAHQSSLPKGRTPVGTTLVVVRGQAQGLPRTTIRGLPLRAVHQPAIPLRIVNDQFGKPSYAPDLARRTRKLVESEVAFGIYHLTNETGPAGITWYQFAREIFKQAAALKILPKIPPVKPCTSKEFPRPAPRPHYSILRNTRSEAGRSWRTALANYLKIISAT